MAGAIVPLTLDLIGKDHVSGMFGKVGAEAETLGAKLRATGASIASAGSRLSMGLTVPLLLAGAASAKLATDFSSDMTRIQTQAGGSARDVKVLSAQVLDLAKSTQQGPTQLAEALYHLKSVGLDNVNAMKALAAASNLAAVGGADLESTTNAVAGAWRSGIKGAQNFTGTVAALNAIVGVGNMKMEDLVAAMGTGFLPSARTFGVSLKQAGAALALMTDEGIPADAAATRLRMSFSLLGAPSKTAADQLAGIGLNANAMAEAMQKPNGLLRALDMLRQHLADSGLDKAGQAQVLSRAFGGGRSSSGIMTLLNNLDVLHQKYDQVRSGSDKFGASVAKQAQTASAKFHQFTATLQEVAIKFGNILLPYLTAFADKLSGLLDWFDRLSPTTQKWVVAIAAAAAAAGPLLVIVGSLVEAVGLLISPLGLVIAGVVAAGVAFVYAYQHSAKFRTEVNSALDAVKTNISEFVSAVEAFWAQWGSTIVATTKAYFTMVWDGIKGALEVIKGIIDIFGGIIHGNWAQVWKGVQEVAKGIWTAMVGQFKLFWALIKAAITKVIPWMLATSARLWDNIQQALLHAVPKLIGLVKSLPGKIKSALGDLGKLLFNAGEAVLQGLIDGIGAKVAELGSKLADVTKFISDHKGPLDKDKQLLVPHGKAIMDGLMNGIKSRMANLKSLLSSMVSTISSNFTDPFSSGSTSGDAFMNSRAALHQAVQFRNDVRKLIDLGMSKATISGLINSGNFALMHALAGDSRSEIARLNHLTAATNKAQNQGANLAGQYVYGDRISEAERQKDRVKQAEANAKALEGKTFHLKGDGGQKLQLLIRAR